MWFSVKKVRASNVQGDAVGGLRYEGRACVDCSLSESVLGSGEFVGTSPFATARLSGMIKVFLPSKTACGMPIGVYDDQQNRTLTTNRHIMFSMLYTLRQTSVNYSAVAARYTLPRDNPASEGVDNN